MVMSLCAGNEEVDLMRGLAELLAVRLEEATDAVKAEVNGECGPSEVAPKDASEKALLQAARVLQAEAVSAASTVGY